MSEQSRDPWVWVASCSSGEIKKRSPKNIGWKRGLFAGPGGLSDRTKTLEAHLSEQVEGPAARALRALQDNPCSTITDDLLRYVAWAAARSLPMQAVYQSWLDATHPDWVVAPKSPDFPFAKREPPHRVHRLVHASLGIRSDVSSRDALDLIRYGWRLQLTEDDFREVVHVQAWFFMTRFFPKLRWYVLRPPQGEFFVVGDRPIFWGFQDRLETTPSFLEHPHVQMFAPLTRSLLLLAVHAGSEPPSQVYPSQINRVVGTAAHGWIAGPTEKSVREALPTRVAN